MKALLSVFILVLLIAGCTNRKTADVKQGLDGTWELRCVEWEGTARDPGQHLELTIAGDRWAWKFLDQNATVGGKCRIDPGTKPASIEMTTTEGVAAGEVSVGNYDLDEDTLKLALGVKTAARPEPPRDFGGVGVTVLVLKRKH